ncbi:hypothetical protein SEUCBS139899_010583 [Sporothrix eucalyptigena]
MPLDQFAHGKRAASEYNTYPLEQENARQGRVRDIGSGQAGDALDLHDSMQYSTASDSNKRAAGDTRVGDLDDVSSKWIHRDKLARIENEELQAAGIILPKPRGRSKPRRDASQEKYSGHRRPGHDNDLPAEPRSRKNSTGYSDSKLVDTPSSGWDLRLPDEIAEESYFTTAYGSGSRGSSRIPVAKLSPAPIALEHIERDTPITRRRDGSPTMEDGIAYPKTRSRSASVRLDDEGCGPASPTRTMTRSASDISPKKTQGTLHSASGVTSTAGLRKASAPPKTTSTGGRPKTRNGASKDSNSSGTGTTRPSTRSGDRELSREMSVGAASRQPEGDPPWMISAYRPDPRLPPDQQLLPTVARRLQQEKWEREGKFGNVYDKEFRPLTDDGFLSPPEPTEKTTVPSGLVDHPLEKQDEWPLKHEAKASSSQAGRAGSYSTIPKIQDKPNMSPLPSPRGPLPHSVDAGASQLPPHAQDDDTDVKQGCGCCVIM